MRWPAKSASVLPFGSHSRLPGRSKMKVSICKAAFGLALRCAAMAALAGALSACADAPLRETGSLSSYEGLQPANGVVTRSKQSIDAAAVLAARTIEIAPTTFSPEAATTITKEKNRTLLVNATLVHGCRHGRDFNERRSDDPSGITGIDHAIQVPFQRPAAYSSLAPSGGELVRL